MMFLHLTGEVAPLAGAWIEISTYAAALTRRTVAPLAGAWIEMHIGQELVYNVVSPPSRGRGLKFDMILNGISIYGCRPPRGGVD